MKQVVKKFGIGGGLLVLTAVCCFAQSSSIGVATEGLATEMIAIAKWAGIIVMIVCGIGVATGGPGMLAKLSGAFLGLVVALFASPLVSWIQSL